MILRTLCAALLFFALPQPARAQSEDLQRDQDAAAISDFDEFLAEFRKKNGIPALSVAIVRDREVVWEKAYGWSDDEGETPATVHTTFSIASVTKPIVATALISEAEHGQLDFETPMSADPGWRETCDWLAGSQILFGTGGAEPDGTPVAGMDCSREVTLRDMLNMRANGDGAAFVYNPISFARIDRVISGAGERDLRAIVRERVMDQVGIREIALGWRDPLGGSALRLLALPFAIEGGKRIRTAISDDDFRASAGIKASVYQLAQFDIALNSGRLLPESYRKSIFEAPVAGPSGDYRWGWFVQNWNGHKLVWHSGWDPKRYSAMYLKVPEKKLTLIVLANTEAVWWQNSLVRAEIEKSSIAATFLELFVD